MKYGEFMAALRREGMKHVFLLAGEEHYFIDKAEKRLLGEIFTESSDMAEGLQRINEDIPCGELMNLLEAVPFFASKNVVLLTNAVLFKDKNGSESSRREKEIDRLIELLSDMPETNYVIFELTGKPDKRRKLYKAVEKCGLVLEAETIEPWKINDWLREKLMELDRRFDSGAMEYFSGAVSMMRPVPLEFLDRELDKLALYTDKKVFSRRDLETMLSAVPEVSGFAMIDAISNHNVKLALTLLERQLADGIFLPVIAGLIARHVRQLMLARLFMAQGIKGKQLAGPLGEGKPINPFIAEKIGRAAGTFDGKKLKNMYLELADADYSFKTGKSGAECLEHIVIELCGR